MHSNCTGVAGHDGQESLLVVGSVPPKLAVKDPSLSGPAGSCDLVVRSLGLPSQFSPLGFSFLTLHPRTQ